MLVILAAIFAVLGFALIVIPFHVAMTGICFLGLSAVCVILRLLRGKKHCPKYLIYFYLFQFIKQITIAAVAAIVICICILNVISVIFL